MFEPNTSYYAGIILDAFRYLLCLKLGRHNQQVPTIYTRNINRCMYSNNNVINPHPTTDVGHEHLDMFSQMSTLIAIT